MARLRKFAAYRRLERPYTRISKFREKSFIRATPHLVLNKFTMGDSSKEFPYKLDLVSKNPVQIRHNALESARMAVNRHLESVLGKKTFLFRVVIYPHHILRENPLASGAGADRMSTGMKRSFGKAIGRAAQIDSGQTIFSVWVPKSGVPVAKKALEKAKYKIPCSCSVIIHDPVKKSVVSKKSLVPEKPVLDSKEVVQA